MTFGTRLTKARKAKKLTQEQLGKGLGTDGKDCSKTVVYGWEKDQHMPRADQLAMICERLDVSADDLLFGKQTRLPPELLPDVAEVARAINDLPEQQRILVIQQAKVTIDYLPDLFRATTEQPTEPPLKQAPSPEQARKLR